jgi:hypothetical protein
MLQVAVAGDNALIDLHPREKTRLVAVGEPIRLGQPASIDPLVIQSALS